MIDYEKKYNEALERAQKTTRAGGDVAMEIVQYIFPELAKSEDERIQKEIIEYLQRYLPTDELLKEQEMVAWLEKQKEQKPADRFEEARKKYQVEWSEEDEKMRLDTIRAFYLAYPYALESENPRKKNIDWLKSLRPSWKPSEEQMEALEYVIRDYREDSCNATANYLQEILDHLKNM